MLRGLRRSARIFFFFSRSVCRLFGLFLSVCTKQKMKKELKMYIVIANVGSQLQVCAGVTIFSSPKKRTFWIYLKRRRYAKPSTLYMHPINICRTALLNYHGVDVDINSSVKRKFALHSRKRLSFGSYICFEAAAYISIELCWISISMHQHKRNNKHADFQI